MPLLFALLFGVHLLLPTPALAGARTPETPTELASGTLAPDFSLQDLEGRRHSLSQYRGKVVFLNFWATWCPPCREELPAMARLNEVYGGSDFVMLAVNVEEDGAQVLPRFFKGSPPPFTVLLDPQAKGQNLYGVYRFPETFIIDKQGRVVERLIGGRDWSGLAMLKWFGTLIKGK